MTPLQTRQSSPSRYPASTRSSKIDPDPTLSQFPQNNYYCKSSQQKRLIPFVSKLTLQQSLPLIFSAFGDGANLYVDVLGLESSKREALSSARLRLAYFRKGREVLASPVEVDDEITTLTYQGISASQALAATNNKANKLSIRSGVPISRKAKKRFQAICLAYEVLSDPQTRTDYDAFLKQQQYYRRRQPYEEQMRSTTKLDTIIEKINAVPISKSKSHSFNQHGLREGSFYSHSDTRDSLNDLEFLNDTFSSSDPDLSKSFSTTSSGFDSILRRKNTSKQRKAVTPTRIRWNEQVEELVIMDYDAQNEHFAPPDDTSEQHVSKNKEKIITQPVRKKFSKKKTPAHSLNHDDTDVWSSSHPFFPEQDVDMPFDESACYFPYKKISEHKTSLSCARLKTTEKGDRQNNDQWWKPEYDDQDESILDQSGFSSRCRLSRSSDDAFDDYLEGKEDDCGVPFSFDLAAGFQVALSKYLGNVLSEMKTGLSELGKTFSDIDVNQNQMPSLDKQRGGNEFFMDEYEVNALMSVLRSEINQEP